MSDTIDLEEFARRLNSIKNGGFDGFMHRTANKTAQGLLARARLLTPVDTGFLRGSWATDVMKNGSVWGVKIENTSLYSSYVEYGHRARGGTGWIEGFFMMSDAIARTEKYFHKTAGTELHKFLKETIG